MELDYRKMLQEIDELVNNDWTAEMELKLLPGGEFSQEDAQKMAQIIGQVYARSHCLSCGACQGKYAIMKA